MLPKGWWGPPPPFHPPERSGQFVRGMSEWVDVRVASGPGESVCGAGRPSRPQGLPPSSARRTLAGQGETFRFCWAGNSVPCVCNGATRESWCVNWAGGTPNEQAGAGQRPTGHTLPREEPAPHILHRRGRLLEDRLTGAGEGAQGAWTQGPAPPRVAPPALQVLPGQRKPTCYSFTSETSLGNPKSYSSWSFFVHEVMAPVGQSLLYPVDIWGPEDPKASVCTKIERPQPGWYQANEQKKQLRDPGRENMSSVRLFHMVFSVTRPSKGISSRTSLRLE